MRIKVLIVLVIIYILGAFMWLTFSLLNYANTDYKLKNNMLKAGLNACTLQVIQQAKNHQLGSDTSASYFLRQMRLDVAEEELRQFVENRFEGNYTVSFSDLGEGRRAIELHINPARITALEVERYNQRNIWLFQSILLLVLVAAGVYGVYYSIDSIYQLNKRQNNFLLSVTHEFKTPIAAIRLMLQTSQRDKVSEEKSQELVEKSIANTYRLEELTENMLTAMQIENKNYKYSISDVDLTALLNLIIENQRIKGEIHHSIEEGVLLRGDGFILRMVINNLVENAFKYSDNAPIEVHMSTQNNKCEITVLDQGIGIAKTDLNNIFKKFYRVQDEETRTTKGTGLGLFIVKQAIKRHGGKVIVKANEPKGSVFKLVLPLDYL